MSGLHNFFQHKAHGSSAKQQITNDMFLYANTITIPPETGEKIDAHGIAKGTLQDQVQSLQNILENGFNKENPLHTAPLVIGNPENRIWLGAGLGTGGGEALRDGAFILISKPGKKLKEQGIFAILVNPAIEEIIPNLQMAYPKHSFISYDKLGQFLADNSLITQQEAREAMNTAKIRRKFIESEEPAVTTAQAPLNDTGRTLPPPPAVIEIS